MNTTTEHKLTPIEQILASLQAEGVEVYIYTSDGQSYGFGESKLKINCVLSSGNAGLVLLEPFRRHVHRNRRIAIPIQAITAIKYETKDQPHE